MAEAPAQQLLAVHAVVAGAALVAVGHLVVGDRAAGIMHRAHHVEAFAGCIHRHPVGALDFLGLLLAPQQASSDGHAGGGEHDQQRGDAQADVGQPGAQRMPWRHCRRFRQPGDGGDRILAGTCPRHEARRVLLAGAGIEPIAAGARQRTGVAVTLRQQRPASLPLHVDIAGIVTRHQEVAGAQRMLVQQRRQVIGAHRHRDQSGKAAVRCIDAAREDDRIVAGDTAKQWPADQQAFRGAGFLRLEIGTVGQIDGIGLVQRGVQDPPVAVQQQHVEPPSGG